MANTAMQAKMIAGERRFFASMAIAMVAVLVIGFLPTYYARDLIDAGRPLIPLSPMVHLHGVVFTAWMLLFLTQVLLVSGGRTDIHRRLGRLGMMLLPLMIVVALITSLEAVARASGPPIVPPLSWLAVPLIAIPVFGGLIAAALALRRDPAAHKRYMFIAMIEMTGPGFGRWPFPPSVPGPMILFGFSNLFLIALIAWDLKRFGRSIPRRSSAARCWWDRRCSGSRCGRRGHGWRSPDGRRGWSASRRSVRRR